MTDYRDIPTAHLVIAFTYISSDWQLVALNSSILNNGHALGLQEQNSLVASVV